jgi:RsiW-degrading membrane proteinase PrsW (M82 family)
MLFVAALLPVVVYIYVVYMIDNFSLVSVRGLCFLVLAGMLSALACYGLFQLTALVLTAEQSDLLNPIVEESVKALPLLWLACRKRIVFFIDSVICGAAVGGGFSILENLFYLLLGDSLGVGTVLFRGLEVALIHMGCSAVVAAALMLAVRIYGRLRVRQAVEHRDVLMAVFLLVAAPTVHVCHNTFLFNPLLQFVFVFATTGGLLCITYFYDVEMIHRWLDKGLDKQLELLTSIRDGQFADTPTGLFLMSVRDSFPPEVFFDIICYVRLHIELAIAAKSRLMIRESGIDFPLEADQKALILSQFAEYSVLSRTLGKAARMTIAPVVKHHPADQKSLDALLSECR